MHESPLSPLPCVKLLRRRIKNKSGILKMCLRSWGAVGLMCPRAEGTLMEVSVLLRQVQTGGGGGEGLPAPTRISLK